MPKSTKQWTEVKSFMPFPKAPNYPLSLPSKKPPQTKSFFIHWKSSLLLFNSFLSAMWIISELSLFMSNEFPSSGWTASYIAPSPLSLPPISCRFLTLSSATPQKALLLLLDSCLPMFILHVLSTYFSYMPFWSLFLPAGSSLLFHFKLFK